MKKLMEGKKGLVLGVANEHSIAWAISKRLAEEGAEIAFNYQNEKTASHVIPLFQSIDSPFYERMDLTDPNQVTEVLEKLKQQFNGELDFIVHAVAGGPHKGELSGKYMDVSLDGFVQSMVISVYSLTDIVKRTFKMMEGRNASILTLSYYGSEKVVKNYNVMGVAKAALESSVRYLAADLGEFSIRVNALSPGTVKTRAASAIGDFDSLYEYTSQHSPLKHNASLEEVANSSLFLLSNLSSGITGQTIYVDAGYSIIGNTHE
ncbi:enoyl-ACP reductase [Neobacillus cucumis]|uniref:enoyl-ACP reductase FabI n=1 Tax=Neobacillus cucumis TaxID=1740721 RepID=UPI002E1CE786|nr:SDR family oxidoreductase [Neobacillus cucumis]